MDDRHTTTSRFLHDLEQETVGRPTRLERPEEGSPVIWIGSDFKVVVGAMWRLIDREGIVVTRDDDGQWFGLPSPREAYTLANKRLSGEKVKSVQFNAVTGDICFQHTNGLALEIVTISSGYESWVMWLGNEHFAVGANRGLV